MRAIKRGARYAYAHSRRLNDGVLLGVRGITHLVLGAAGNVELPPQTFAPFLARLYAGAGAVITGGKDALVLCYDRSHLTVWLKTAGPRSDLLCHIHKSKIPFCPLLFHNTALSSFF